MFRVYTKILFLFIISLSKTMFSLNFTLSFFLSKIRSRGRFYSKVYVKMVFTHYRTHWYPPKMVANVHKRASLDGWHKHLGHPSQKLVTQIVMFFSLPIKHKDQVHFLCTSCSINKAHKQPFHSTSLVSNAPLHLIYTDVWGPSNTVGLDGS